MSLEILTCAYSEVVGELQYMANTLRPDISFSVEILAPFCSDPNGSHEIAAKRVPRYLKKTLDLGITNRSVPDLNLIGHVDF